MGRIGRHIVAMAICIALYLIARLIWTFPMDQPSYWFGMIYSYFSGIIYSAVIRR
jgi:hypothetical protein